MFGPRAVSFVERSITPCPYLRGSTIRGSTVLYIVTSIKKQLQKIEKKVGMEYQKAYKQG